jgi:hypothetical protein
MAYFELGTGWHEQLGKLIGDTFAALIIFAVLLLAISQMVLPLLSRVFG